MMNRRNLLLVPAALAIASIGGSAMAKDKHCPPGLAKKSPACVPPGQAKKRKYHDHDDHDDGEYYYPRRGDRIDRYDGYRWLRDYDRYDLPRLRPGERYYVVDGRIYRVNQNTYEILNFVSALDALLN